MMRPSILLLLASTILMTAGCGGVTASAPPTEPPAITTPDIAPIDPSAHSLLGPLPALVEDSVQQYAQEMTVRIRNVACDGQEYLGSGFALTHHIVVTNRHVLEGATELELDTWNGQNYLLQSPAVGRIGDIGFATSGGYLPRIAKFAEPPQRGTPIMAVGYPLGGPLTITYGKVMGYAPITEFNGIDPSYHRFGQVMIISAYVTHGNSGGPVLDSQGRVVGVVFALDSRNPRYNLAISISAVKAYVTQGGLETPSCG